MGRHGHPSLLNFVPFPSAEGGSMVSPRWIIVSVYPVYAQPRTLGAFDFVFQDAPQCKGRISDGKPQKERTSPSAGGFAGV